MAQYAAPCRARGLGGSPEQVMGFQLPDGWRGRGGARVRSHAGRWRVARLQASTSSSWTSLKKVEALAPPKTTSLELTELALWPWRGHGAPAAVMRDQCTRGNCRLPPEFEDDDAAPPVMMGVEVTPAPPPAPEPPPLPLSAPLLRPKARRNWAAVAMADKMGGLVLPLYCGFTHLGAAQSSNCATEL